MRKDKGISVSKSNKFDVFNMVISGIVLFMMIAVLLPSAGRAQNIRGYYPGDWVSYTNTRYIRTIAVGFDYVYFGTTEGILIYDMGFNEWKDPITRSDDLDDQDIRMIAVEPDDSRIYVSTASGAYMYETTFDQWSRIDAFPMHLMDDNLDLISNFQKYMPPAGFHALSPNILEGPFLRDFPVVTAAEDQENDIWIGTWGLGAGKIESYGIDLELLRYGLYTSNCHTMYRDGPLFYFGCRNDLGTENALTIWNLADTTWQYFEAQYDNNFSSDKVNDIMRAGDYIYLATDFGLVRMNPGGGNFRSYTQPGYLQTDLVLSLEYYNGDLFVGTDQGMYVLDAKTDSITYMGGTLVGASAILDIFAYKGDLWIGSDNGAIRYDFSTNRFYRYSSAGGALLSMTYDIEPDPKDGLWFATEDAVIWMSDKFDEQLRIDVNTELNSYHPYKLVVGERFLWIATDYGVYRYDRMQHDFKHYTMEDGLIDNSVYDMFIEGDYLWMATAAGVTRFFWNNPMRGVEF
jgi:ligand-binding sensor domain-containing protein